jgi:hypothetical protein
MFFYEQEEFDQRGEEFTRVLEQYGDAPEAVLALYMIGRTSERRTRSSAASTAVDYDVRPLKDARRHYERFLEERTGCASFPTRPKKWVRRHPAHRQERLASVYERMLRKQLKTAEYYDWKGLPWSAEPFYIAILRDERPSGRCSHLPRDPGGPAGPRPPDRAQQAVTVRPLPLLLALGCSSCGYEVGNLYEIRDVKVDIFENSSDGGPTNSI